MAAWDEVLAVPMAPLVAGVVRRIEHRMAPAGVDSAVVDTAGVCAGVARWLGGRLVGLAARTLVLELHQARRGGPLRGATPQERFAAFADQLAGGGMVRVLAEYPVLARLLDQEGRQAVEHVTRMLTRFATDRGPIVGELLDGSDPGPLVALELAKGDRHHGGQSVARLGFAGGRAVLYKPRNLALHQHFGRLAGWLSDRNPGLSLRTPRCVARPDYGWMEFIATEPCADGAGAGRFYRRLGALLALLYAVDGADFHYENLIASGDQPVLVDVETLFHPLLPAATAIPDPAADAIGSSVLRIGLLPHLLFGRHGVLDISGVGGDAGAAFPWDTAGWEHAGTDRMRLVRGCGTFRGAGNRPRLRGADLDPGQYRHAIIAGFLAAYRAIATGRDELTGLLARCAGDQIRILVRPTMAYTALLAESTHPDVLRGWPDRDRLFDVLRVESLADPVRARLVRHEVGDLHNGDVPAFTGTPGSRDVWASDGTRVPGLLPEPGLTAAVAKIHAMGEADRARQEWLITAALGTRTGPAEHGPGGGGARRAAAPPAAERLLTAACSIGDELAALALRGHGRANWLGLELADERHWAVLPMGAGLADGYCGVALFLAQLAALSGADRYADLARQAIQPLPGLIDHLAGDRELAEAAGPGGFLGLGGIAYALARLGTLLGGGELDRWLAGTVDLAAGLAGVAGVADLAEPARLDVIGGAAGGLAAMRAVHAESGLPAAERLAHRYARTLVEAAGAGAALPAGFARGPAGIAWALRGYARDRCDGRAATAARDWLRRDRPPDQRDPGWCSGLAGAALAHGGDGTEGTDGTDGHGRGSVLAALATRKPAVNLSLCHGELGIADVLGRLPAFVVDPAELAGGCGTPGAVPTPGLLSGLAGIGYGLLRGGFPELVPSVLALEPGRRTGRSRSTEGADHEQGRTDVTAGARLTGAGLTGAR